MGKQVDDLKLGARASFWVTINDSETNGTNTAIDVRQFYGTVANPEWGEVLIGKDFGLFARSNILLDELLAGYGQVSDTLGLVDGGGCRSATSAAVIRTRSRPRRLPIAPR